MPALFTVDCSSRAAAMRTTVVIALSRSTRRMRLN
jgi:hypothetical protein